MPRPKLFQNGLLPMENHNFKADKKWKPAEEATDHELLKKLKEEKEAQKAKNLLITKRRT